MKALVAMARAMADSTRVRVLAALRGGELCVCELCDGLGVSQSTLSTHLQVMRDAGLVNTRKQGKWIYYSLNPELEPPLEALFTFFEAQVRADKQVLRDASRISRRLSERDGGECCRGFEGKCCPTRVKQS